MSEPGLPFVRASRPLVNSTWSFHAKSAPLFFRHLPISSSNSCLKEAYARDALGVECACKASASSVGLLIRHEGVLETLSTRTVNFAHWNRVFELRVQEGCCKFLRADNQCLS